MPAATERPWRLASTCCRVQTRDRRATGRRFHFWARLSTADRPAQTAAERQPASTEAEIWAIVRGTGTVTTGGRIVETRQDGKVVSRAIEGGESRRVTKGDFIMIPEGVPHYVTEASPEIVFMAIEFPRPRAAQMPPAPTN